MKKYIVVLISFLLIFSLIAGCAQTPTTPTSTTASSASTTESSGETSGSTTDTTSAGSAPMEIAWSINSQGTGATPLADGIVPKAIEEKFNVKLTFFPVDYVHNMDQWNLKISAGEIPDVWNDHGWSLWNTQGIIKPITEEMISQNMPHFFNEIIMKQDPDKKGFRARSLEDGSLIGIPNIMLDGRSSFLHLYRQDWLDAVGLQVPTTLDELENVLKSFTLDDPDGNGVNDTFGVNCEPNTSLEFGDVFGAFGTQPNIWIEENGKVVYSNITDAYKQALKRIATWYKAGYINQEFPTDSWDQFIAKFTDNKIGSYYLNWWYVSTGNDSSPVSLLLKKNPEAKLVTGDAVVGTDGKKGAYGYGPDIGWSVVFKYDLPDEKIIKCMEIIDYLQYGEGAVLNLGGIENETFKYDEFGKTITLLTPEGKIMQGIGCLPFFTSDETSALKFGKGSPVEKIFTQGVNQPWIGSAIGITPLSKSDAEKIGADLGSIYNSFFTNAVIGKIDIDSEWDAYVKQCNDSGLAQRTIEANEIYQKYYSN